MSADRRPRAREAGIIPGSLPPGRLDAITDVAGVRVGQATVSFGSGRLRPGAGPARTGVTLILPHGDNLYREKVRAAALAINGFGKAFGFEQVRELGLLESPIALTNTLNVGRVADALVGMAVGRDPSISSINVLVGETNDSYLNDIAGRHVGRAEVEAAWAEALGPGGAGQVAMGSVGAGTGTTCFGWKGGIGTASRVLPAQAGAYTLGALVQTNFGRPEELTVLGAPVGRSLRPDEAPQEERAAERGSVMIVLATDAPLSDRQLGRLCVRAGAGLARTGARFGHGSGDFVVAFSTAERVPAQPASLAAPVMQIVDEEEAMRWLFPAVIEAVEESVLDSLLAARTVEGRDGHVRRELPLGPLVDLLRASGLA